jgi:LemA protein
MELMNIVAIAVAIVVALAVALIFNALVAKRQMANNGWSDIDVQLKRRADLIPQLVTTVQAYAAHERQLFEDVAEKRNRALAAGDDPAARGAAESELARPVGRLIALAEGYPDLKANGNFLDLQKELADTEDKIEMARRFYNGAVRELNTRVETFPANIVAALCGVGKRKYFEIGNDAERAVPTINAGGSR